MLQTRALRKHKREPLNGFHIYNSERRAIAGTTSLRLLRQPNDFTSLSPLVLVKHRPELHPRH